MFVALLPFLASLTALITMVVPMIFKSDQTKEADRDEKAKENWDTFYHKTDSNP